MVKALAIGLHLLQLLGQIQSELIVLKTLSVIDEADIYGHTLLHCTYFRTTGGTNRLLETPTSVEQLDVAAIVVVEDITVVGNREDGVGGLLAHFLGYLPAQRQNGVVHHLLLHAAGIG